MSETNGNGAESTVMKQRNILVAVDDSDASEKACDWAIKNLYRDGDELHFFHVIPIPMPQVIAGYTGIEGIVTVDPDPREDQLHIEEAKKFIGKRFVSLVESAHIPFKVEIVRFLTDNDSIGEVICKRAEAINAASVVMASHNKGPIKEFFLGSVTKYATHHCKQPVLVLRE